MRKKIKLIPLLSLFICLCVGVLWMAPHQARAAGEHMFSVKVVDDNHIWVCGDRGIVYSSVDGGLTWEKQDTGVMVPLRCIDFYDANTGWAAGKSGTIIHTKDGGKTWEKQTSPKIKPLFAIEAVTPEKVWAAGDWGTLLYTEDGGQTWQDRTLPEDVVLYDIDFQSEDLGWISGEFGTILHTTDGGVTWNKQDSGVEGTLFGISFDTPENGTAVGLSGMLVQTQDGGQTWQIGQKVVDMQRRESAKALFEARRSGDLIVLAGDAGMIVTSTDSGETWNIIPLPLAMKLVWFRAMDMYKQKSVIVGAYGTVVVTQGDQIIAMGPIPKVTLTQEKKEEAKEE